MHFDRRQAIRGNGPLSEIGQLLEGYYRQFPREIGRHEILASQLRDDDDVLVRGNMRGHVTTSATVLDWTGNKVLLIHHKIFDKWLPPGGHFEAPGTLWQSAVREVAEETGLLKVDPHAWTVATGVPIDIDTHPIPENSRKGEGAHFHHDIRFLAVASDEHQLRPQPDEVHAVRWAAVSELRESPDERVRALHSKLARLGVL